MNTRRILSSSIAVLAASIACLPKPAHAASGTWLGTTSNLWQLDSNWSATPFPGAADIATFNGAGNGNTTIDLGGTLSAGTILFDTASAAAYTIGSGAVGSQTLNLATLANTITIAATVANNQLFNASLSLATTGAYAITNNSTTNSLTFAGGINASSAGIKTLRIGGAGNTIISGAINLSPTGGGTVNLEKTGAGTLTLSGGGAFSGNGINAGNTSAPVVLREGTTRITGGNYAVVGEIIVGANSGVGAAGTNVNFTMDGGSVTTDNWVSIARGNGTGGVSSDAVLNNNATISAANLGIGFNNGNGANLPKGSLTLNNASSINITGGGRTVNLGESAGSNATVILNDSAVFNLGDSTVRVGLGGTTSLTLNGASHFNHAAVNRLLTIGTNAGGRGTVTLNGTSILTHTANITAIGEAGTGVFNVASSTAAANVRNLVIGRGNAGVGAVYNTGTILGIGADGIFMGDGANSASYFRNDNAAAVTANATANNIVVGIANGSVGVFDVLSGSIGGNTVVAGRDGTNTAHAQFNITGGSFSAGVNGFTVASNGATNKWANLNVTGGAFSSVGPINLSSGNAATNTGILSVKNGVTVVADTITAGGTSSNTFINVDGGTLQASGLAPALVGANVDRLTVYSGGLTVDTAGLNKSIDAVIAAPTGSGLASVTLSGTGTGYEGRPVVKITGDGTGASAMANFDPVTGQVTGVTITSPGSGYTTATATILGGGGTALTATTALGAVSGGDLTKIGAGALALSGANTYTGVTNVNAGALSLLNTTGSATGTGAVNMNTGTTLTGTGISSGLTTIASGAVISPGNSGIGTLTLGSLTLQAGAFLDYEITDPGTRDLINVSSSNGLTINGGSFRLYQPGMGSIFAANGVYNLIGYSGTIGGTGIGALEVDPTTVDGGKSYTFGTAGGFVTLSIATAGSTPNFWNVDANGNWTTGANWTLGSAPNAPSAIANFGGGGATITAPRTVTLDADQTVGTIGFNSAQSYTVTGANTLTLNSESDGIAQITVTQGAHTLDVAMSAVSPTTQFTVLNASDALTVSGPISGITSLIKNGAGTLSLTDANTYVGSTTLAGGTLALSGSGTLGNISNAVVVTGGTLNLGGTSQTTGEVTISGGTISNGTIQPTAVSSNGSGTSTISADIAGIGGVTQSGNGTLVLSGNNSYTGDTVVNTGVLAISSPTSLGSLTNVLSFSGGALRVDGTSVTDFGAHTVLGFPSAINLTDGGNTFTVTDVSTFGVFAKQGAGKLRVLGTSAFDAFANLSIQGGTLEVVGTLSAAEAAAGIEIAPTTGSAAALSVLPGSTVNTNRMIIGGNGANTDGGAGTLVQTGGTINARQWFTVGSGTAAGSSSSGVYTISGGVLNASTMGTSNMEVANFAGSTGVVNISGSAEINLHNNAALNMGSNNNAGSGTVNQDGGTVTFFSDAGITPGGTGGVRLGAAGTLPAGSVYTYNLNGGTLATPSISRNTGGGNASGRVFNFNGGTLKATATNATFIVNTINTNVKAGGARIDSNGFAVTIPAVLAHDAALGSTPDGGLIKQGAGILTLSGANSFTGNILVSAGTLSANAGGGANPVTSALGNNTIAGRGITVSANATLNLGINDVFGNQTAVAANLPSLVINGGTLNANQYNQIGALTLNGGGLTNQNTTNQGNYQNFQFLAGVTVTGSVPSFMSSTGAAGFDGNHLGAATLFNVANVTGDASADLSVSAPFRNQSGNYGNAAGGLIKAGPGTMVMTGANTYAGATTVNAGTLITSPAQTGATTVTVADGATFGVKLATAGTTFSVGTLTSGSATGSTLTFDTGLLGNPTTALIAANTFNPAGPTLLNVTGTGLGVGSNLPLLDYTGTIGGVGFAGLSLALPPRVVGNLVDNAAATRVDFNITQIEQIKWKGNVNGVWDADTDGTGTNGTQNWVTTVLGTPTKYLQGTGGTDAVNFDDSATGTTDITITTAVTPLGITFNNATKDYTFSSTGAFGIGGTGALTKNGNGSLTLNTSNSYSGGTTINAGAVIANGASALGNGPLTVNGGNVVVNNASALGIGPLTINAGTMVVNHASALGNGALTINGGGLDSENATVLSTNNAQAWNGDFAFAGTSALDMGVGAVTVGGAGANRVITVSGSALTVGELRATAHSFTKEGAGTLVLTSTGAGPNDGSRIAGVLNANAGTLQINRAGTNAAESGDLTPVGVTGAGTIVNGAAVERWLISTGTGVYDFSGTLTNGGTGGLGFAQQGTGTQTLSGANSYTGATTVNNGVLVLTGANTGPGTNATVNAGKLVLANPNALGANSLIRLAGNASTLTFATDGGDTTYAFTQGTTTNSTIISDRATPGPGISHPLTTQFNANGVGGGSITFTSGPNVTSGTGSITMPLLGLGAGTVETTVLNPTTANVSIGDISKQNNNVSQTVELGGTSQNNEVTGGIFNGVANGANNVSVVKSGTSKWTLGGFNSYTGSTTVNAGTLIVQGTLSGSTGVTVNAGTIGGSGNIDTVLNIGNGAGTQDAILAPGASIGTLGNFGGVNFLSDAVFALEIDTNNLATDLLNSSSAISLGVGVAKLNVTDLGSTLLSEGQIFAFMSGSAGITGEFAGMPDGHVFGVGANFFEINYNLTSVELISVPEPASAVLLLAGGAFLGLRRSRRRDE